MLSTSQTTLAVADAITCYRQIRELTINELSFVLLNLGHEIDADDLRAMEGGASIITVDDLVALAVALDVSPAVLISHVSASRTGSGPLASGVPDDVDRKRYTWVKQAR